MRNDYAIRAAESADLQRIGEIYAFARNFMAEHGNPHQWGKTRPAPEQTETDLENHSLYVICSGEKIHGVFSFFLGEEPTYRKIFEGSWHREEPYGVIHRIAGDGSGEIFSAALAFCRERTDYLRIDTHRDNAVMQHLLQKAGFSYCGRIYLADGSERLAYDAGKPENI